MVYFWIEILVYFWGEINTQALQMKMLTEEANKRKWLMNLYGHISNRLTVLHDSFETLSQRYVSSNPKIHASMHEILHEADNDIKDLPDRLIPDKETFFNYTQIDDKNNDFTPNEKLFLMLLSCNADNRQIATFMNTSIESIRVRKSQLKKKVINLGYSADIFNP